MTAPISNTGAPKRDANWRREAIDGVSAALGRDRMFFLDGRAHFAIPLDVYFDHLSDHELETTLIAVRGAAAVVARLMGRDYRGARALVHAGHAQELVEELFQIATELLVADRDERAFPVGSNNLSDRLHRLGIDLREARRADESNVLKYPQRDTRVSGHDVSGIHGAESPEGEPRGPP